MQEYSSRPQSSFPSEPARPTDSEIEFLESHNNVAEPNSKPMVIHGDGSVIKRNYIHHQHQLGIFLLGGDSLVEGNEIAFNNY
ncbi:MAG: hypothetical protein IH991_13950, partial [Planctomycetes bacterium]|nr:hypothetical protein [Planctomycetota bacterium]